MLFSNDPRAGIFADDLVHTFETTELMPEPTTITLLAPARRVRRRPDEDDNGRRTGGSRPSTAPAKRKARLATNN
jgi:hypothetical protein